jgi:hypothetical protein
MIYGVLSTEEETVLHKKSELDSISQTYSTTQISVMYSEVMFFDPALPRFL